MIALIADNILCQETIDRIVAATRYHTASDLSFLVPQRPVLQFGSYCPSGCLVVRDALQCSARPEQIEGLFRSSHRVCCACGHNPCHPCFQENGGL